MKPTAGPGQYRLTRRWQVAIRVSDLLPTTRLVAQTLATFADADGFVKRVTMETIAEGAGLSRSTAAWHVRLLRNARLLGPGTSRGRVPNRYTFTIPEVLDVIVEQTLNGRPNRPGSRTVEPSGEPEGKDSTVRPAGFNRPGSRIQPSGQPDTSLGEPWRALPSASSTAPRLADSDDGEDTARAEARAAADAFREQQARRLKKRGRG